MQLFSADVTIFKKKNAPENMKKLSSNWPNFFFRIANRPKAISNLIFCSIKMSPHLLYLINNPRMFNR